MGSSGVVRGTQYLVSSCEFGEFGGQGSSGDTIPNSFVACPVSVRVFGDGAVGEDVFPDDAGTASRAMPRAYALRQNPSKEKPCRFPRNLLLC